MKQPIPMRCELLVSAHYRNSRLSQALNDGILNVR